MKYLGTCWIGAANSMTTLIVFVSDFHYNITNVIDILNLDIMLPKCERVDISVSSDMYRHIKLICVCESLPEFKAGALWCNTKLSASCLNSNVGVRMPVLSLIVTCNGHEKLTYCLLDSWSEETLVSKEIF